MADRVKKAHGPVSDALRRFIRSSEFSQDTLAKMAGKSPATVSRFMTKNRGLSMEVIDSLAAVLGLRLVKSGVAKGSVGAGCKKAGEEETAETAPEANGE